MCVYICTHKLTSNCVHCASGFRLLEWGSDAVRLPSRQTQWSEARSCVLKQQFSRRCGHRAACSPARRYDAPPPFAIPLPSKNPAPTAQTFCSFAEKCSPWLTSAAQTDSPTCDADLHDTATQLSNDLSLSFSFSRVFRANCMRQHGEGLSQQVRDWPHVPDSRFPLRSSRERTGRSSRNPSHFSHGAAIDSLRSFICRNPLTNW